MDDFPEAAGPSIATTANRPLDDDMGKVSPEIRIRDGNAIRVIDPEFGLCGRAEDAERHGQAVITVCLD